MFCSNIPATLLFCNYVSAISIPTQKDGEIHSRQLHLNALIAFHLHKHCLHQTLPPLCEGAGTRLDQYMILFL